MPLYTYSCKNHGEFDCISTIEAMTEKMVCPTCHKLSPKVIVLGHGGVQRKDPEWVRSLNGVVVDEGNRPVNTIEDLRRFYRENPNVRPKDSHPAFKTSDVDAPVSRTSDRTKKHTRRKKAAEVLRKHRSISINP